MKKVGFIAALALLISSASFAQSTKNMSGLFEGYDGAVYSFSFDDEEYMMFDECAEEVLDEYDLKSDDLLYETFNVTYIVTENEDGDTILKIIRLEIIESED